MGIVRIQGAIADYPWGGEGALSHLLGWPDSDAMEAEWWLGTHPLRPSHTDQGEAVSSWLASKGSSTELPYLFKILAPHAPLSLQVHPSAAQAKEGFAREEADGIPLDAPTRLFKDPHPKPELVVALGGPFHALAGIRPVEESISTLEALGSGSGAVDAFVTRLRTEPIDQVISWLLAGGDEVSSLIAELESHSGKDDTLSRLVAHYPGDPGIAVAMLMNRVTLLPGESLLLDAGQLHAYLEGFAIELMAPSDNVLRGGLTSKHVDVPGLLAITDFTPTSPPRLEPKALPGGGVVFAPEGHSFSLGLVEGSEVSASHAVAGPTVVVCTEGEWALECAHDSLTLSKGQAALVDFAEESLRLTGTGQLWWAFAD